MRVCKSARGDQRRDGESTNGIYSTAVGARGARLLAPRSFAAKSGKEGRMSGELIRQTMKRLGRSMIALPDLRRALARELPGMDFDLAIKALAEAVRVDLHIHSQPAWLEP